jgi:hypothetical protein
MKFLRLYIRVLEMLGREARLGWILAAANLALATATFIEPILFGRIVDMLANAQGHLSQLSLSHLMTLVGAWVAFSPSSAARWWRSTPTGSPTANTRWCEPSSSSTCCSFR